MLCFCRRSYFGCRPSASTCFSRRTDGEWLNRRVKGVVVSQLTVCSSREAREWDNKWVNDHVAINWRFSCGSSSAGLWAIEISPSRKSWLSDFKFILNVDDRHSRASRCKIRVRDMGFIYPRAFQYYFIIRKYAIYLTVHNWFLPHFTLFIEVPLII